MLDILPRLTWAADKAAVEAQFEKLIAALDAVGMRTEVRSGRNGSVLVFVRIRSAQKLIGTVYRSRFVTRCTALFGPPSC